MNRKEILDQHMLDITDTPSCSRAGDLVAYLYGEASKTAATDFEQHTQHCASCRAELSVFSQVRASIGAWRNQSLAFMESTAHAASAEPLHEIIKVVPERKRSALAALREFFALSPMWLRGATAFASAAFCLIAVLAVAQLMKEPTVVVMEKQSNKIYTEEELKAKVESLTQERLAQIQSSSVPSDVNAVGNRNSTSAPATTKRNTIVDSNEVASANVKKVTPPRPALRPFTQQERHQLAAELRLTTSRDEDELPPLHLADIVERESN